MPKIKNITHSILNSYSQIFFSKNKIFAIFLVIVSFLDWWLGIAGLVSVVTANFVAYALGYNRQTIRDGIYGFNPLLTGLAVGVYFAPALNALLLVIFVSILTFFISVVLQGIMAKYAVPFLSLPFLFAVWLLYLGFNEFSNLGISVKDIYTYNELYSLGGLKLVQAYEYLSNLPVAESLKTYFLSLGAIFFQYNILSGIIISVGLLLYSRQAFLMSLIGFYAAYGFYFFLGVPISSLNHTYFGFNFILSAIAIGSYFLLPSWKSLIWTLLLIPILVIITIGTGKVMAVFHLPLYSLPFNLVVIGFIYALALRSNKKGLTTPVIHQRTPEETAYYHKTVIAGNNTWAGLKFSLPFFGKWTISQGVNGKYTHKDAWHHAWDFVIKDDKGEQYSGNGVNVNDYYCYDKPVVAVADGTVVAVVDNIPDNAIGDVNIKQNWGNTIVIQHGVGIYSQYSHLKAGSIKVYKGMFVSRGQQIANVGNSGRSPYPHLHFQFQNSSVVGSKTAEIGFNDYIVFGSDKHEFIKSGIPKENEVVSNLETVYALKKMLKFVPGSKYEAQFMKNGKVADFCFYADIDIFNNSFLADNKEKSKIYFSYDNTVFNALNYAGSHKSPLFILFNALYFVPFGYYKKISFSDEMPLHLNNNKLLVILQDFVVNILIFLRTNYTLEFLEIDDDFNPMQIKMKATIVNYIFNKKLKSKNYLITLKLNDKSTIELLTKNKNLRLQWQKKSR